MTVKDNRYFWILNLENSLEKIYADCNNYPVIYNKSLTMNFLKHFLKPFNYNFGMFFLPTNRLTDFEKFVTINNILQLKN